MCGSHQINRLLYRKLSKVVGFKTRKGQFARRFRCGRNVKEGALRFSSQLLGLMNLLAEAKAAA